MSFILSLITFLPALGVYPHLVTGVTGASLERLVDGWRAAAAR